MDTSRETGLGQKESAWKCKKSGKCLCIFHGCFGNPKAVQGNF